MGSGGIFLENFGKGKGPTNAIENTMEIEAENSGKLDPPGISDEQEIIESELKESIAERFFADAERGIVAGCFGFLTIESFATALIALLSSKMFRKKWPLIRECMHLAFPFVPNEASLTWIIKHKINLRKFYLGDEVLSGTVILEKYVKKIGTIEIVQYILDKCINVDTNHSLFLASRNSNKHLVKALLAHPSTDVNCKSNTYTGSSGDKYISASAMHGAARRGNSTIVKLLHKNGGSLEIRDKFHTTPILGATETGRIGTVQSLCELGANIEAMNPQNNTPLLYAAWHRHYAIAQYLIKRGANLDARDHRGNTSLHKAAWLGYFDIVQLLCESGADIESVNQAGKNALTLAMEKKRNDVIDYLCEKGANIETGQITVLQKAVEVGDLRAVQSLCELGANIEAMNPQNNTPLLYAAWHRHYAIAQYLIKRGANLDARDHRGNTSLHKAAWLGYFDIVQLLCESGADIESVNDRGHEAMTLAKSKHHNEIYRYLHLRKAK